MNTLLALAAIVQLPQVVLGGQKQLIYGLIPEPALVLSYYTWVEEKPNEYGSSTNVYSQRLGYAASKVKKDVFNNEVVSYFETDGRVKKDINKEFDIGVSASEKAWVNPETGHIYRQYFTVEMPKTGERVVEAIYGTQTVELTIKEGGKSRDLTLHVEGGCLPFFERFKPMVVGGKVIKKEKNYYVLDPYSLSYVKGSVVAGSRFESTILLKKMRGNVFNLTLDGKRQRAYITDKNELVKVDISDTNYLQVDSLPMDG